MQLDRNMLDRLLMMNDEQLGAIVRGIAAEAGIDPAQLGLNPDNIQSIRAALKSADEEDIRQLNEVYSAYRSNRRRPQA